MEKNQWFISSENGLNKFKHGLKSLLIFIVVPIIIIHIFLSYILIPMFYETKFLAIVESVNVIFENGFEGIYDNGELLFNTLKLYFKLQINILLYLSPVYFFIGFLFFKIVRKKTEKLLNKEYISGSQMGNIIDILYDYLKEFDYGRIDFFYFRLTKIFMKKKAYINNLKFYISPSYNFELAGIPLLKKYESSHVLIPGASRKGKSQILRNPIFKAKELSMDFKAKGIITDEKGEWFSKTGDIENGDLIFNPLDERSLRWTIFNDIENIIDIENYSKWIIPENASSKDPFWINSARDILKNCLIYLWNSDKKTNEELKILINSGQENIYNLLYDNLSPGAAEFLEKKDSYLSFKVYMSFIDYLEDGDFSVREWINQKQGFIYLTSNVKTKTLFSAAMTLFVNVVGSEILAGEDNYDENKKTYLFLEEFTSLNKLEMIIHLLKLSGSKGVSVWLAFQDFQQITKIYSKDDMASIINNCSTVVCLGLNEPDAAEYFSKRLGEQVYKEKTINHSMGIQENRDGLSMNEQVKRENIVLATDLINLPALNAFVKLEGSKYVTKVKIDINKDKAIQKPFILNECLNSPLLDSLEIENKKNSPSGNTFNFDLTEEEEIELASNLKTNSQNIDFDKTQEDANDISLVEGL